MDWLTIFKEGLLSLYYERLLNLYPKILPRSLATGERKIAKNSLDYLLYREVISLYSQTLRAMRRRGYNFSLSLQERRLQKILLTTRHITWWKNYFKKQNITIEDGESALNTLKKIPPIRRTDLIEVSQRELLTRDFNRDTDQLNATSGSTTGTPFFTAFSKAVAVMNVTAHYVHTLEEYGFPFGENSAGDFITYVNLFGGVQRLTTAPEQFATGINIQSSENGREKIQKIKETLNQSTNPVLFTHPSEIPSLIQKLKSANVRPKITACLVIGQMLEDEVRMYAEEYFSCPVISLYGLREKMLVATSCKDNPNLFHPHMERAVIEILDERSQPAEDSEYGNITITGLDNFLMPLLRYQPGDRARSRNDISCNCENQSPLFELDSRNSDSIISPHGTKKSIRGLLKLFGYEPFVSEIKRFQIIQKNTATVQVLIEIRSGSDGHTLKELLASKIVERKNIPEDMKLEIEIVDTINTGNSKYKVFVPLKSQEISK